MFQAQMPEPAPEVEHRLVEKPPNSPPPVEEPPPGELVPATSIPGKLSATLRQPPQVAESTIPPRPEARSWLAGTGLAAALLVGSVVAAQGQTPPPPTPSVPPGAQGMPPAEITPSHPANGRPAPGAPGTNAQSGPQTETPAPLPPGARPDTPGGMTSNGVARPRESVDPGISKGTPAPGNFTMPVIPPPGTPGGNPAWFKKCHFQVTPGIDRALMVKRFFVLGVTLI